ncbi:MAG: hypothetical protein LBM06_02305 [Prevotellaceae bacterium]|jgi:hypothetical protein|nr:hypothetical protein [Prevotellaceae bacterium]
MEEDNFYRWFRREKYTIILTVLCALVSMLNIEAIQNIIVKAVGGIFEHNLGDFLKKFPFALVVNLVIVIVTFFSLIRTGFLIDKDKKKSQRLYKYVVEVFGDNSSLAYDQDALFFRMKRAISQFYYAWLVVWGIWFLLYGGQLVVELCGGIESAFSSGGKHAFTWFNNTLNLINSLVIFYIYLVITASTVKTDMPTQSNEKRRHSTMLFVLLFVAGCFVMDFFSTFLTNESQYTIVQLWIELFVGAFASISLMAVLGRLNSSYLNIPIGLILGLYLYAAIQMVYPYMIETVMNEKGKGYNSIVVMPIISYIAAGGKLLLYLVIQWVVQKRRFLFFLLHKANSLIESDDMLEEFNQIYGKDEDL